MLLKHFQIVVYFYTNVQQYVVICVGNPHHRANLICMNSNQQCKTVIFLSVDALPGEPFVRSCTSDSISVTWGAAFANSGFLRYRISISPEDALQDVIYVYATEPDLVATFAGLNDATLYTITVELEPSGITGMVQQVTSK